ncbi:recombinase family protein [Phycisphaerales bacterium AB-hyl4]|uniref:Recombinase family protein n=1 Tax=Natronomicrosphaera hydrolytica TaxID=3242702 RepID=A0ABV4U2D4_9BACT
MTQAIGYIRRSSDRQEESLQQQQAQLEAFAASKGWQLVAVYSDDAISGSDLRRPGLEQLLADAAHRQDVDVVLTWDRNRLARPKDPLDGMLLERRLTEAGKRVMYAATGQESQGGFAAGLMSYVEHHQNGDYLRKLSRDTIRGIAHRVQRGFWPGGPIPFGYDRLILGDDGTPRRIVRDLDAGTQAVLDPTTGDVREQLPKGRRYQKQDHEQCTLVPSMPERVRALQKMFSDYAAGKPTRELRDAINAAGFRTSRGSRFTVQTILPILENPAYLGRCVYNRRTLSKWHRYQNGNSVERHDEGVEKRPESDWLTVEGAWPALVDADTFEQVKHRRTSSREQHRHTTGRAVKAGYLLTGLAFCGICGGRLTGQTTISGKGYRTRYYVCATHHAGHHDRCPKRHKIPADKVEGHILGLIREDVGRIRHDHKLHEYIADELRRVSGGNEDAREQLKRRQDDLGRQIDKVREHLLAMDAESAKVMGLYEKAAELTEQQKQVEQALAKLGDELPTLPEVAELQARAVAAFDELEKVLESGTLEEKRELIAAYVQKIKAEPDHHQVQISLYPALFSRKIAGGGFEPPTSGL